MIKMGRKGIEIPTKSGPEHFHLARIKKGGERFEITINPDLALDYVDGKDVDIKDVLLAEEIFKDAKRGMEASGHMLEDLFGTTDVYKIAEVILKEGEIQLTQEYREKLREQKRKQIVEHIHRNAIDARTNAPVPVDRIENALEEKKVKIDEHKTAEDQVKGIIKELQSVIPMKIEIKEFQINFHPTQAGNAISFLKRISTLLKETWNNDGTLTCIVQIPAGLSEDFINQVNSFTHGNTDLKEIKK